MVKINKLQKKCNAVYTFSTFDELCLDEKFVGDSSFSNEFNTLFI